MKSASTIIYLSCSAYFQFSQLVESFLLPDHFKLYSKCSKAFLRYETIGLDIDISKFISENSQFSDNVPSILKLVPQKFGSWSFSPPRIDVFLNITNNLRYSAFKCQVVFLFNDHQNRCYLPIVEEISVETIFVAIIPAAIDIKTATDYFSKWTTSTTNYILWIDYTTDSLKRAARFASYPQRTFQISVIPNEMDFHQSPVIIFDDDTTSTRLLIDKIITPQSPRKVLSLRNFPRLLEPLHMILLELQRTFNYTPFYAVKANVAGFISQLGLGINKAPVIFTSAMGLPPTEDKTYFNKVKAHEDTITILYCYQGAPSLSYATLLEIWVQSFDHWIWIGLLSTGITYSILAQKLFKSTWIEVFGQYFRQMISSSTHFKGLHLLLSFVLILVIILYECNMTSRVIAPGKERIIQDFEELLDNDYLIYSETVQFFKGITSPKFPLAKIKLEHSKKFLGKNLNVIYQERKRSFYNSTNGIYPHDTELRLIIQYKISRVMSEKAATLAATRLSTHYNGTSCHIIETPVVRNNPVEWVFSGSMANLFFKKMTQYVETGITTILKRIYDYKYFTLEYQKRLEKLRKPLQKLSLSKLRFVFVVYFILIGVNLSIFSFELVFIRIPFKVQLFFVKISTIKTSNRLSCELFM